MVKRKSRAVVVEGGNVQFFLEKLLKDYKGLQPIILIELVCVFFNFSVLVSYWFTFL